MDSSIHKAFSLLTGQEARVYISFTASRVVLNVFDIVGVALLGALGATFSAALSGDTQVKFAGLTWDAAEPGLVLKIAISAAVLFVLKSLAAVTILAATTRFLARVEAKVADRITRTIFSHDLDRARSMSRGEIFWAAHTSSFQAVTGLLGTASNLIAEASLVVGIFALFLFVDYSVAAAVATYFAFVSLLFFSIIHRRLRRIGAGIANAAAGVADSLDNLIQGFREIRTYRLLENFLSSFKMQRTEWASLNAKQTLMLSLPRYFMESALMIGVLLLAFRQLFDGSLHDGVTTASIFLAGGLKILAALIPLQNSIGNYRVYAPQAKLALTLLKSPQQVSVLEEQHPHPVASAEKNPSSSGASLEVSGLTFSYPDSRTKALSQITFEVSPGEIVALVGRSGAGKSTLVDLILGFHKPLQGAIRIDGLEVEEFLALHPRKISYVPQSPAIFQGSLASNISLVDGHQESDRDRIWNCLEKVGLHDWAAGLPEGIDTGLGKQSDRVSGGQRQRIGLARALFFSPRLIILDEVTSALDPKSEAQVGEVISSLSPQCSVLLIAHRETTTRVSNRVMLLEGGQLRELGPPQEPIMTALFSEVFGED